MLPVRKTIHYKCTLSLIIDMLKRRATNNEQRPVKIHIHTTYMYHRRCSRILFLFVRAIMKEIRNEIQRSRDFTMWSVDLLLLLERFFSLFKTISNNCMCNTHLRWDFQYFTLFAANVEFLFIYAHFRFLAFYFCYYQKQEKISVNIRQLFLFGKIDDFLLWFIHFISNEKKRD